MNLKKFFYRDYYEQPFSFVENNQQRNRAFDRDKPESKADFTAVKKSNAPVLKAANEVLVNASLQQQDLQLLVHKLPAGKELKIITVKTVYPGLVMGSGYVHETLNEGEFKLGFYFDYTTGLPCLPGSSIKGLLRSLFPQWPQKHPFSMVHPTNEMQAGKADFIAKELGWENDADKYQKIHQLELAIFEGVDLAATNANKDKNNNEVEFSSTYMRCCFYNAYISKTAGAGKIFETDTITPHTDGPLKNPTPLNFLKIRSGVTFCIPVNIIPVTYLNVDGESLFKLFTCIIKFIGIGAKTNVGYGQFEQ